MALQGPVGEIRTNQEHFSFKNEKKIKNQPQTKFTGSYKKKCKSKQNYYWRMASKLGNVQRNSKTYWSLLVSIRPFFKE